MMKKKSLSDKGRLQCVSTTKHSPSFASATVACHTALCILAINHPQYSMVSNGMFLPMVMTKVSPPL